MHAYRQTYKQSDGQTDCQPASQAGRQVGGQRASLITNQRKRATNKPLHYKQRQRPEQQHKQQQTHKHTHTPAHTHTRTRSVHPASTRMHQTTCCRGLKNQNKALRHDVITRLVIIRKCEEYTTPSSTFGRNKEPETQAMAANMKTYEEDLNEDKHHGNREGFGV